MKLVLVWSSSAHYFSPLRAHDILVQTSTTRQHLEWLSIMLGNELVLQESYTEKQDHTAMSHLVTAASQRNGGQASVTSHPVTAAGQRDVTPSDGGESA